MNNNSSLKHLAIMMDGNRRWAKKKGLPGIAGHRKGALVAKEITYVCLQLGIKYLTLFTFSSENWKRPEQEISGLMKLLNYYLGEEVENFSKRNIRLRIIGDISKFDNKIIKKIQHFESHTQNNSGLNLNIALNYGGKQEIIEANRKILYAVQNGEIKSDEISEEVFAKYLYTSDIPDPDLLIRTSGEQRISNFLLWQLAYSELYFTDTLWPDFKEGDLIKAINAYKKRERRYGAL